MAMIIMYMAQPSQYYTTEKKPKLMFYSSHHTMKRTEKNCLYCQ